MANVLTYVQKEILVFGNFTANSLPSAGKQIIIWRRSPDGGQQRDSISVLPGMMIAFRNISSYEADSADIANLSIAEYLFSDASFFLK